VNERARFTLESESRAGTSLDAEDEPVTAPTIGRHPLNPTVNPRAGASSRNPSGDCRVPPREVRDGADDLSDLRRRPHEEVVVRGDRDTVRPAAW